MSVLFQVQKLARYYELHYTALSLIKANNYLKEKQINSMLKPLLNIVIFVMYSFIYLILLYVTASTTSTRNNVE